MGGGYEYHDDIPGADAAFRAWGGSLGELFSAAWMAVRGVMLDAEHQPAAAASGAERRKVELTAGEPDLLLLDFLQEQLYLKDADGMLYVPISVTADRAPTAWHLSAELAGEPIDTASAALGTEVKAVTLDTLGVRQTPGGWEATVVLDL